MSAPPPIGSLRTALTIEQSVDAPDDIGGASRTYVPLATTFGAVRAVTGTLLWRAGQQDQVLTHAVTIRGRTDLDATMRLRIGARILQIRAIEACDDRGAFQRLLCEETAP